MKAEERKALEQNSLVHGLEEAYEGVKKGPSSAVFYWVGGIVAVALVVGLFWYFTGAAEAIASARWAALANVAFPGQLEDLLSKSDWKDTPQGRLARFKQARLDLAQGLRELGIDKKAALKLIETAAGEYEALMKASGRVPVLQQEAIWGAAKARETLGEIDKAKEHYQRLVKDYEKTALGEDAAKQIKRLDDPANTRDLAEMRKEFGPLGK